MERETEKQRERERDRERKREIESEREKAVKINGSSSAVQTAVNLGCGEKSGNQGGVGGERFGSGAKLLKVSLIIAMQIK